MTCVLRHAIQAIIVMIVWNSIIVDGVPVTIKMAKECVLKELYMVSNVFFFTYKIIKFLLHTLVLTHDSKNDLHENKSTTTEQWAAVYTYGIVNVTYVIKRA